MQGKMRGMERYRTLAIDQIEAVTGAVTTGIENFTSETSVVVAHNNGFYPQVTIVDVNGVEFSGQITHDSVNQLILLLLLVKYQLQAHHWEILLHFHMLILDLLLKQQ